MDLFDILKATIRRWYIAAPLILLTAMYSYHVYNSVKPVYYANSIVSVAAPNSSMVFNTADPGAPVPRNGLIEASGTATLVQLTIYGLQDQAVRTKVAAAGGYPGYEVKMLPSADGIQQLPLAMVDVTASDPETAQKTIAAVLQQVPSVVRSIQLDAGVPESLLAKPITATQPGPPTAAVPSRSKAAIVLFLAGTGISVLIAVLADIAIMRRRPQLPEAVNETPSPLASSASPVPAAADDATERTPRREPAPTAAS